MLLSISPPYNFFLSLNLNNVGFFWKNLWAKGDHLMETSHLKTHPFGNHYPEWMPNLHSDRGQDSNPCAWRCQGPQSPSGSTVPRWPQNCGGNGNVHKTYLRPAIAPMYINPTVVKYHHYIVVHFNSSALDCFLNSRSRFSCVTALLCG